MSIQSIFKAALAVVTVLVLSIFIAGFLTPSEWSVSTVRSINKDMASVSQTVSTLKTWPVWTAWNDEKYPELTRSFAGPDIGPGSSMTWDDGNMTGTITMQAPANGLNTRYMLDMGNGRTVMNCGFDIATQGVASEVTWFCNGSTGSNPVERLMMKLIFVPMMRADFDEGLANLETYSQ